MSKRPTPGGFTMIELLVVISVMVILSLIALPSLMGRTVREQVTEALPLADIAKPAIEAAWKAGAPLPADNAAAGLPVPEKIVSQWVRSLTVQDGAIHIAFGNKANKTLQGKILTLRPAGVADARVVPVTWLCGPASAPAPMTAQGPDNTNVPAQALPLRCR
jgi:type IV pilus assembly protein PilA